MVKIEFKTDNDAFRYHSEGADAALYYETARILREIADKVEKGTISGPVKDANGNTVGWFKVS